MKFPHFNWSAALVLGCALFSGGVMADSFFEVTVTNVTNVTKGMTFTPIMLATTRRGDLFFRLGDAASEEVATMAETGDLAPLMDSLDAYDITNSSFLPFLGPGESVTQMVAVRGSYRYLSIAAMLIPSNDTFFGAASVVMPYSYKPVVLNLPAYDAGSELNDELCDNLPGPGCGEDPGPFSDNGEGFIYISNGIRGGGDLDADALDFNNPVARVVIKRASGY